ncbi:MAG: hypothetical protein A2176_11070, partial [Spirochaetes bacterium RBG_13_51_14]
GIDLGLLVVAVDDGWMPQTEDHFRVLQLLGVERIIVVLNKIDLVDEETAELVEQEALERIADSPYNDADIVRVSSKTGAGIEDLRKTIAFNLKRLAQRHDGDKPFLFIDRVFASKGYGTIVTGTLRNGVLRQDDLVHIQPGAREARVKRIESHRSALTGGVPSQRAALNLSGVSADGLARGHVLYRRGFFTESDDIVALIRLLDPKRELKNNAGIEVLIGTAAVRGKIILFNGERSPSQRFAARVKLDEPWFSYPGQPFVMAGPGGFRILGGGMVLLPGYRGRNQRDRVMEGLELFKTYDREERIAFLVSVHRWMKRELLYAMLPESDDRIDAVLSELEKRGVIKILGDYAISAQSHDDVARKIAEAVIQHVGINLKEISDYTGADADMCRLIIAGRVEGGQIYEKEGRFFAGSGAVISDGKKKALDAALKNGVSGIELERIADESMKRDAKELVKLDLLVSLDGNILYHRDIYEELKNKIISLFGSKDKISVPEAKEAVGLSRKFILPLLNRIERDGLIKRLGDFRVKA